MNEEGRKGWTMGCRTGQGTRGVMCRTFIDMPASSMIQLERYHTL
jgi:hypothetical protein